MPGWLVSTCLACLPDSCPEPLGAHCSLQQLFTTTYRAMTEFDRLAFTPPPARTYWEVIGPDGQPLRTYRTQQAAKQQLKRFPAGSTVKATS